MYQYVIRLKYSFMFNQTMRLLVLIRDTLFFHLLVFTLPAYLFMSSTYTIYIALTYPCTLMLALFVNKRVQSNEVMEDIFNTNDQKDKVYTFYEIVSYYDKIDKSF